MAESNSHDNEIFIDADAGFQTESNSYEVLLLKQMHECVKTLSREMTGGQIMEKTTKSGSTEKYVEDVRELVINHVDALRMLMSSYIKGDNKKQLEAIMKEIKEYKEKMMNTEITIPGRGKIKIGDFKGVPADHPIWKDFIHFKALRYREIFEILANAYNEEKAYIRSLEEE